MKHKDFKLCLICGKGVMHEGQTTFYKLTLNRFVMDLRKVKKAHGLEQFFGGGVSGAVLANIMGPDEDLAIKLDNGEPVLICQGCALKPEMIVRSYEMVYDV